MEVHVARCVCPCLLLLMLLLLLLVHHPHMLLESDLPIQELEIERKVKAAFIVHRSRKVAHVF
uniref:Secreted protein n=1 Tax=Oryza brachyantha TaxID=4533 RepID=J3MUD6_ORYBR